MVDSLIRDCLTTMEVAFRRLERRVPAPRLMDIPTGPAMRYKEKTIHQAILQKAARLVSGLHAIRALMSAGLCQEQAVIQQTVDEIGEDIMFLALAAGSGQLRNSTNVTLQSSGQRNSTKRLPLRQLSVVE